MKAGRGEWAVESSARGGPIQCAFSGSAQQQQVSCASVATLQQCTAQSPCSLNLSGCDYSNAQLPGFYNTGNMSGTIFAGANLAGAFFGGNSAIASFAGANLAGATLQKNASNANLTGATVTGTTFLGNTNNVACTNLVVGTIPGSSPPAADLPTGLPASCFGNVTVTCPPPAACLEPGVASQGSGWVCQYTVQANGTSCDDDNACTSTDTCQSGVCTGESDPCLNGGTCTNDVTSYSCTCAPGYSGANCETNVDECSPNPCQNGGTCTDGVDSYACACAPGYEGANCETAVGCAAGLGDCDGSSANGCEVILDSDADNCGACGSACATGQICTQGACQAPPSGQTTLPPIDVPDIHGALAPATGDLDGDGNLDVLVANAESGSASTPSGSLTVRRGVGDGNLQAEEYYTGAPLSSNAVVVADVDGDGWLDAITVNGQTNLGTTNGSISVYLNGGASAPGVFGAPTHFSTGAPGSLHLCAADFDGDGNVDIATTSVSTSKVSVLFGDGLGGFGAPQIISILNTGGVQSTIGAADLNADGRPDLVVTSPGSSRLSVLLNQGGTFAAPVAYANAQGGFSAGIAFGDVNGDGKLDVLSNGSASRFLYFFKGNGNGTLSTGQGSAIVPTSNTANSALGVVAGDFNGDGKLDAYVLRTAAAGGVYPMTGNGAGGFALGTFVPTGASPGLNALATADMNHDGYLDLILTNRNSATITVILNAL